MTIVNDELISTMALLGTGADRRKTILQTFPLLGTARYLVAQAETPTKTSN